MRHKATPDGMTKHVTNTDCLSAHGRSQGSRQAMSKNDTLWDMVTEERIAIEALVAAIDTYLSKPSTREYRIGAGLVVDLAGSVARHGHAQRTMKDAEASEPARRMAVRSALLMSKPARS